MENNKIKLPDEVVYDRGDKGKSKFDGVKISTLSPALKKDTQYQKRKKQKKFKV